MIPNTSWTWIFLVFPWAGALAAVFVYECIYKRAQVAVEVGNEIHEAADNLIEPSTNDP